MIPFLNKPFACGLYKHMWKGNPISGPLLCEMALELNKKLGCSSNFKASKS